MFETPLLVLLTACAIAGIITIPTIYVARKYNLVTDKRRRSHPAHTHKGIIPRAGGIPIYLSLLITSLLFLPMNKLLVGILISNFFLLLVGLMDDYYDVSPYLRFIANLAISTLVVLFGLGIPYISNPFGEPIRLDELTFHIHIFGTHTVLVLANVLSIIWLTWIMNMVNWSKGVDGQLPGFVAICALFLGLLSQRFTDHDISAQTVMLLSFIVAGAYLGFLPFNFYPQKIMPGYGGGAIAGFLLGILSILTFGKIGTAVLILSVPMIDAFYTLFRRIKNKKSPFKADWGHFHHKLLEIGWGKRRIALFYWIISFLLGMASLMFEGIQKFLTFITVGIFLIVFIIIIDQTKKTHTTV